MSVDYLKVVRQRLAAQHIREAEDNQMVAEANAGVELVRTHKELVALKAAKVRAVLPEAAEMSDRLAAELYDSAEQVRAAREEPAPPPSAPRYAPQYEPVGEEPQYEPDEGGVRAERKRSLDASLRVRTAALESIERLAAGSDDRYVRQAAVSAVETLAVVPVGPVERARVSRQEQAEAAARAGRIAEASARVAAADRDLAAMDRAEKRADAARMAEIEAQYARAVADDAATKKFIAGPSAWGSNSSGWQRPNNQSGGTGA